MASATDETGLDLVDRETLLQQCERGVDLAGASVQRAERGEQVAAIGGRADGIDLGTGVPCPLSAELGLGQLVAVQEHELDCSLHAQ